MSEISVVEPTSALAPTPTPAIILTPEQSRAQDAVAAWLKTGDEPFFVLHGAAGVGKTSLAKHLAGLQNGSTLFAAYAGKAAAVLRKKGCTPASTIHSLIYAPLTERNEELRNLRDELDASTDDAKSRRLMRRIEDLSKPKFVLRDPEKTPLSRASLLILDECSMANEEIATDLLSFDIPILVLGDPYQLPPLEGTGYFDRDPDFMLTEIHRQAAESPVIQLATRARDGKPLTIGQYGSSLVTRRGLTGKDLILGVSQVLSCSNKARIQLNGEIRKLLGYEGQYPRKGERLICLRNNPQSGLFNGEQIELAEDAEETSDTMLSIVTADEEYKAHKLCFTQPERLRAMPYGKRAAADEFDYANCVTVHKFQGSQAPSVLVWDDLWSWDKEMQARSRYTALTRAEERVVMAL